MDIPAGLNGSERLLWITGALARGRAMIEGATRSSITALSNHTVSQETMATMPMIELHDLGIQLAARGPRADVNEAIQEALAAALRVWLDADPYLRYVWMWGIPLGSDPATAHQQWTRWPEDRDLAASMTSESAEEVDVIDISDRFDRAAIQIRALPFMVADANGSFFFESNLDQSKQIARGRFTIVDPTSGRLRVWTGEVDQGPDVDPDAEGTADPAPGEDNPG